MRIGRLRQLGWKARLWLIGLVVAVAAAVVGVKVRERRLIDAETREARESLVVVLVVNRAGNAPTIIQHVKLTGEMYEVYRSHPNITSARTCILPDGSMYIEEVRARHHAEPEYTYLYPVLDGFSPGHGWARRLTREGGPAPRPRAWRYGELLISEQGPGIRQSEIVIHDLEGNEVRKIHFRDEWDPVAPALSPDGSRIAFYYARRSRRGLDLDGARPTLGLGIADLTGNVRILAEPSLADGGLRGSITDTRPFWTPDGSSIYFVAGPSPDRPTISSRRVWPCTYRYDLASGKTSFISPGVVRWMASDAQSIILGSCPGDLSTKGENKGFRVRAMWRLDLPSGQRTKIPGVSFSPSGEYAFKFIGTGMLGIRCIRFYRTSDWASSAESVGDFRLGKSAKYVI